MKYLKKYGVYVLLAALAITLISFGSHNKNIPEDKGVTYVPTPIIEKAVTKEESLITSLSKPKPAEEEKTKAVETAKAAEKPKTVETSAITEKPALAFSMPVKGEIAEHYSGGKMVYSETTNDFRTHNGIDIKAEEGADVSAAAYGTVTSVKDDALWGIIITVDHGGGLISRYCGLSECFVSEGNTVDYGVVIGKIGNTAKVEASKGAHLHFEAVKDGATIDPESLFY